MHKPRRNRPWKIYVRYLNRFKDGVSPPKGRREAWGLGRNRPNARSAIGVLALFAVMLGCLMLVKDDYHRVIARANRWAVYYCHDEPAENFAAYDVVVFDAQAHPPLQSLKSPHRIILGYISYGEEATSHSLPIHQTAGVRLEKNTLWGAENYILDLRSATWQRDVLENQIPALLAEGFDGIMIDTIEAPLDATRKNPVLHAEMQQGAIALLKATRKAFPDMPIMLNRGFDILPEVAPEIDMLLGESVLTDYDFTTEKSHFRSDADMEYLKAVIAKGYTANRNLRVFSLNYWPPESKSIRQQLYDMEREKGHVPYVATIDLFRHIPEPRYEREMPQPVVTKSACMTP